MKNLSKWIVGILDIIYLFNFTFFFTVSSSVMNYVGVLLFVILGILTFKVFKMKNLFKSLLLVLLVSVIFSSCGYERIDAGYEGIKVKKYGDSKGVDQVTLVTGAVWYNPIREDVYEVPIFMQDYNYSAMEFKTADMMSTTISAGVQVALPEGQTPQLFVDYRSYFARNTVNLDQLMYKHIRKGFSNATGKYKAEELIIRKEQFVKDAESEITYLLGELGFEVKGVFLLNDPSLPEAISKQVDSKIEADQIAQKKESELRQTEADAKKREAEAMGKANAMKIEADAQRYAYEQKQRSLTPLLVQQQFIEKWNGDYGTGNVFGDGPIIYKNIGK